MSQEVQSVYDLTPGRRVGDRYEIVGAHRQGGLSAAFEVRDSDTGDRCELQMFPSALFETEAQALDFAATWEGWTKVHSDHVTSVREIYRTGTTLLLITDFPEGDALRARLDGGVFDGATVGRVGRQLLSGLVQIHVHGLVHGDIKPHTIHVTGEEERMHAVLVDGGITPGVWTAKKLGDKTALIGTPYYAPVEQFGGDAPDIRSDVYNVATVLFEMATGVLPWEGSTFLEVFQAKLDKTPPSMKARAPGVAVDPNLEEAIVGGLLADRRERYPSAQEFLDALSAVGES